jgi:hypothetical protein
MFAASNAYMWLLLLAYSVFHFGFIVHEVFRSPLYSSGWQRFQAIYALWLNSGTMAVVAVTMTQFLTIVASDFVDWDRIRPLCSTNNSQPSSDDQRSRKPAIIGDMRLISVVVPLLGILGEDFDNLAVGLTFLPWALLLPPLFTMWVPSLVVFAPISMLFMLLWGGTIVVCSILGKTLNIRTNKPLCTIITMTGRLIGSFLVIVIVQLWTNYAILFYSGNYSWPEVMSFEYRSRNVDCYVNALLNKLQLYNLGLAGVVLS